MHHRKPIADHQSHPEEYRELRIAQITLHPLRQVEEAVLEHIGGVDPALEPRVHAEFDHPPQAVSVPLEELGEHLAFPGPEPLEQANGLARRIIHEDACI
jgi:hypothetical protein